MVLSCLRLFCASASLYVTLVYLAVWAIKHDYCTIKRMKVFDWLIRIQHLECYCLENLSKHNNEFKRKITKENNRITPRMNNIIRCCLLSRKSRYRSCIFERKSRCNETFVVHECFQCRIKSCVQLTIPLKEV